MCIDCTTILSRVGESQSIRRKNAACVWLAGIEDKDRDIPFIPSSSCWDFVCFEAFVVHFLIRAHPVHKPTNLGQVYLIRRQFDVGAESMGGKIDYGNKGKPRTNVLRCVMSDDVSTDQIPECASDENI